MLQGDMGRPGQGLVPVGPYPLAVAFDPYKGGLWRA
jgi:hypothetical protein